MNDKERELAYRVLAEVADTFHCRCLSGTRNGQQLTEEDLRFYMKATVEMRQMALDVANGDMNLNLEYK